MYAETMFLTHLDVGLVSNAFNFMTDEISRQLMTQGDKLVAMNREFLRDGKMIYKSPEHLVLESVCAGLKSYHEQANAVWKLVNDARFTYRKDNLVSLTLEWHEITQIKFALWYLAGVGNEYRDAAMALLSFV